MSSVGARTQSYLHLSSAPLLRFASLSIDSAVEFFFKPSKTCKSEIIPYDLPISQIKWCTSSFPKSMTKSQFIHHIKVLSCKIRNNSFGPLDIMKKSRGVLNISPTPVPRVPAWSAALVHAQAVFVALLDSRGTVEPSLPF